LVYKASGFFPILNIGILYLSGGNFHFLLFFVTVVSGVCLLCIRIFFPILVCWVRGNFPGGPGHVYISCVFRCVEWRAGSILFDHCGGVDGGTVQIFFLLWLYSGGYSTGGTVRGGGPFFLLLSFSLLSVLLADGYW
jgi:hypothetical protein